MATSPDMPRHHALAVPLPAQGHINPLMRFCKLLVSRCADVIVTFVNVDPIHHRILELKGGTAAAGGGGVGSDVERPRIRFAHVALPTLDLSNDFRVSLEEFLEAQKAISPGLEDLIGRLNQEEGQPPVTFVISDLCMTSPTQLVADKLGLPRVALFPSSQSNHLFHYYVLHGPLSAQEAIKMAQERDSSTFKELAHEEKLEGLAPLQKRDLPCFKHVVGDDTKYMYHFATRECEITYERSNAIVVNSFMELEGSAIEAFSKQLVKAPLYPVGPLIEDLSKERSTSLWMEDEECMVWLDKQPPNSVLYVSFGSITILSKDQFEEVLAGIELSNQRFLWAFRPDLVEGTICIPQDFLEKIGDRGYIATWVPQLSVLKHPSIGSFLTHCGWNSTIEAVASGVPMLCWPYFGDQFMDAKYIIEEWKVGLGFHAPHNGSNLISRLEIERVIRAIMEGDEGKILRKNASRLKEAAMKSHDVGGSSTSNIEALIKGLQ